MNIGKFSPNGKDVILKQLDNGCIECTSHSKDKCGYVRIYVNGKHQRLFRVLYEQKYGKIDNGLVLRHKCDNPSCCNINHLELGTVKENVEDMINRKRAKYSTEEMKSYGENNGSHKLTEKEVLYIYNCKNKSWNKLADEFNVTKTTIYNIKQEKCWKWLTNP